MTRVNIILLGESGVGKTTLANQFKTGVYTKVHPATIDPVHFLTKNVYIKGKEVSLFLWDTSGEEKFRAIVNSYYRKGEGVLLLYDVNDITSFYKLSNWVCDLRRVNEISEILIVGNKNDDPTKKTVNTSMVKNFARDNDFEYMEISAKTGENVDKAFERVTMKVLIRRGIFSADGVLQNDVSPDETEGKDIVLLEKSDSHTNTVSSCAKKKGCCSLL